MIPLPSSGTVRNRVHVAAFEDDLLALETRESAGPPVAVLGGGVTGRAERRRVGDRPEVDVLRRRGFSTTSTAAGSADQWAVRGLQFRRPPGGQI